MKRSALIATVLATLAGGLMAADPVLREIRDEDIDRAIDQARKTILRQQQADGHWAMRGHSQTPAGGHTALALFALLESGMSPRTEEVKKGLDALAAFGTDNTYVRAMRVICLSQVEAQTRDRSPYFATLKSDVDWLTKELARQQGAWGYKGPERDGDNSCSQFALMALWEAQLAGIELPQAWFTLVERTWIRRQLVDGGWTYAGQTGVQTPSTAPMTTAGLASLYICADVTAMGPVPPATQRAIDRGWEYLAKNLQPDFWKNGYLAFCLQRCGMASGRKRVGSLDWFAVGAGEMAKPNPYGPQYRGTWGPLVRACFELVFLARGRTPLTINKLQYGDREAVWNFHSRDVPRFTRYMLSNFEQRMRWQVVHIDSDLREMLDAPILLVSGTGALEFTDSQWQRLRDYTLHGGTLLFTPTNNSDEFVKSVVDRLPGLYEAQRQAAGGHYELASVPVEHPVYKAYKDVAAERVPMQALGDGTRDIAFVCHRDVTAAWQRRQETTGQDSFVLGVNLLRYATGANPMATRMRPVFIAAAGKTRHTARVAWLKHGGNWNSSPFALESIAPALADENKVGLQVTAGAAIAAEALKGHDLAWMTGSEAFTLTDEETAALKAFVMDQGGTLFVNAVGGSRAFSAAAEDALRKVFDGTAVASRPVGPDSGLLTGKSGEFRGPPIEQMQRSRSFGVRFAEPPPPLQVYADANGRIRAILAPYGIHDTLDGHTAWEAVSYMPATARPLAVNVILAALANARAGS